MPQKRRIGYLSGGLRSSTRPEAALVGPRAHILGVIGAFKRLGWDVQEFIVGDWMPVSVIGQKDSPASTQNILRRLAIDLVRIVLGIVNAVYARLRIGTRVDFVYERLASFQALGWLYAWHGVPWVLESNAVLFKEAKEDRHLLVLTTIARLIERQAYRRCDLVVAVSETLKQMLIEYADVPADKIIVLPNAANTAMFDPAKHTPTRCWDGFTIGFVGDLFAWHALDRLMDVIQRLRTQQVPVHLTVVGDGAMRDTWERYSAEAELGDAVTFVGRVPWQAVPAYIAGFDIGYFGFLANTDGELYRSPLKLYEYMAMATPVLAADHVSIRQIVVPGRTGFLFEPGDTDSLEFALQTAYESRAELARMGRAAREEVVNHHNWDSRIERLLASMAQRGLLDD